MRTAHWALMVGALAIAGCNKGGQPVGRSPASSGMTGHMDSGGIGMGAMAMQGMAMMGAVRAHMDSLGGMSPQQMQAMMAAHEALMSQMLDAMGADMRGMKMPGSPAWTALTDSVKQDLAELPSLKGQELSARMRAHAARVERLMAMHRDMMGR